MATRARSQPVPPARKRPIWKSALLGGLKAVTALAIVGIIGVIVMFAATIAVYRSYANDLVPPNEVLVNKPSAGAKIYDRNGTLLYQFIDDRDGLRTPVTLEQVSPAFLAVTIATEDYNFFDNPGVNHNGLFRAAAENLNPFQDDKELLQGTGGSSITQQLVKNVYISHEDRSKRSLDRKAREIVYAIELTKRYSKEQILDWYVNQISYGGIYSGVEAASQGYFGKPAKDLTLAEAALLAGIPQSPAAYDPQGSLDAAIARRNDVLTLMEKRERIAIGDGVYFVPNKEEIEQARQAPVQVRKQRFPILAPHWVLTYIGPELENMFGREALLHDGLIVNTTLDLALQDKVQVILNDWIKTFESSNTHNGAMEIIDPKTGEILVMIGSRDYYRDDIAGQVNNVLAKNSPGSSFKPFVYLTSFLKLGWTPGTVLQDSPIIYRESNGATFQPLNPITTSYAGNISLRNALGNSLNVPAFKTAQLVGVDNVVEQARKMGFTTLDGQYGPSIAIGGVDLALGDLVYGYSIFANSGVMVGQNAVAPRSADERELDPVSLLKVTDARGNVRFDIERDRQKKQVVPSEYTYMISNILSDPGSTCTTFGCGGIQIPGYQVSVKTGTSQPFDPNGPNGGKIGETWAFGFTADFVVGVWAGNSDNSPLVNILSTSISFRAMRDALLVAYNGRPQTPTPQPQGLVRSSTCINAPTLPSVVFAPAPGVSPLRLGPGSPGACSNDLTIRPGFNPNVQLQGGQQPQQQAAAEPPQVPAGMQAIDKRTGQPASPTTPPEFVELKPVAAQMTPTSAPPAAASTPVRAPTGGAVTITSPAGGSVSGPVAVTGTAASSNMQYYRLEYSRGGGGWSSIGQWSTPVQGGSLATWSTAGLTPGQYTLRLTVQDAVQGALVSTVNVTVQ